jgi:hypothetical protein
MTERDRRALAIGAVVVAVALLVLRIGPWAWRAVEQSRSRLEDRAMLLARMRAEVSSAPRLEDSGAVIRSRLAALAPALLTGKTTAEALGELGSRLSVAAERERVRVKRTEPLADSIAAGGLVPVTLRAALESDTRGMIELLGALAGEGATVVVRELKVAVSDPHVPSDRPERLQTELTITGWYLSAGGVR